MVATNGKGWIVEEYKEGAGWSQSLSFPEIYTTKEDAERVLNKRLKGNKEFRCYEKLILNV